MAPTLAAGRPQRAIISNVPDRVDVKKNISYDVFVSLALTAFYSLAPDGTSINFDVQGEPGHEVVFALQWHVLLCGCTPSPFCLLLGMVLPCLLLL